MGRSRLLTKIAKDIDTSGNLTADAISSDVTLGGATIYSTRSNLPTSGNTAGDQAYVTGNNRLYIWNGSGWYNVALLNVAPSIQSVLDSDGGTTPFSLALDGTATTITITATDSDGDPVTYEYSADSDFSGLATISQDSSVFTITPFGQDSATTTSGTITFTATDGINVGSSGVQTFILNFLSPLWDEVLISIGTSSTNSLDNSTFVDRSSNASTVTTTGAPIQTTFHPYLDNWSVYFDGVITSVVSTQAHADFTYGTGDFTIEWWAWSELDNKIGNMVQQRGTDGPLLRFDTTHVIQYFRGAGNNLQTGTTVVEKHKWNHFAMVRNSGTMKIYINGVEELSFAETYDFTTLSSVIIGHYTGTEGFVGYIADVRIVKGTAVYTTAFTPPTAALTEISGTSLLASSSNRFIDNSSANHTLTSGGTAVVSAFNPFGPSSFESEYAAGQNKGSVFLTSNSQLEPISGSIVDVGTGDFTAEFWCYGIPNDDIVVDLRNGTSNSTGAMLMSKSTGFRYQSGSTATTSNGPDPAIKQWLHIAVVRNSGNVNIYANGVGESLLTGDTTAFTSTSIAIGSSNTNGYDVVDGYVSDLRISKSAVYTSDFTPPTEPVGNTNASLYLPMDNVGIFDKTGNHILTPVGNASTSTAQTKFADTAMYFDGTGDWLFSPYNEAYDFGSGNWTIEGWVNFNGTPGTGNSSYAIASKWDAPSAKAFVIRLTSSTGTKAQILCSSDGAANIIGTGTTALSSGTWYHIAAVQNNGTVTLYVDGTSEATISVASVHSNTADLYVGASLSDQSSPTQPFDGYLENFQILRGVAKYTANFTPPTQTQGRQYQAES
jgi:hypothetical protein